jgi:phosphate transport system substrate-binding protein
MGNTETGIHTIYRRTYMRRIISVFIIVAAGIAFVLLAGCSRDRGNKVVIKGSTTVLPIAQKASEEFRREKGISVSLDGSGSGNGIKALLDGFCDIANSSRELKPEELEAAKGKGLELKEIAIAYDMVVPIVHPSNKVKNLTIDQLKGIYDGSIKNWKVVGGADEQIVVVSRDTSSGTYEVWHEKVMKKTDTRKDALLQASNGAIINTVGTNQKAIGYVGFGYINDTVHAVKINSMDVSIENGRSGKFPVSRKLFMIVNEQKYSNDAKAFIDFILSDKGQGIVKETGFIPLN